MNLEESLKFTKKAGLELEPKEYVFLGCNKKYLVAVSRKDLCFYGTETMTFLKKLCVQEDIIAADMHSNMLLVTLPSKVVLLDTNRFDAACFAAPGIKKAVLTYKYLILHIGGSALLFESQEDSYGFREKVEGVEGIKRNFLVLADCTRYLLGSGGAPDATSKDTILGKDVIDIIESRKDIIVTEKYLKVGEKEIKHSMEKDVLAVSFRLFTILIKRKDTLFYLVEEDELELDEELNMVSCRQQDGIPMGVLFFFGFENLLYFLDEGYYVNKFCVDGIDLSYKPQKELLLSMFDITQASLVTKTSASFSEIFSDAHVQEKTSRSTKNVQKSDKDESTKTSSAIGHLNTSYNSKLPGLSTGLAENKKDSDTLSGFRDRVGMLKKGEDKKHSGPFVGLMEDLDDVIDRLKEIRIRGRHIKIFRYYESTDLYSENLDLYKKIKAAECIIEDIKSGVFGEKLCADIDMLMHRIKEMQHVSEGMIWSNILYIDSKILGKKPLFRRVLHYKQPLVHRNTYSTNYEDLPPLQKSDYSSGGLIEFSDVKDVGDTFDENAIDLESLSISALIGPAEKKDVVPTPSFLSKTPGTEEPQVFPASTQPAQVIQVDMPSSRSYVPEVCLKGETAANSNVRESTPAVEPAMKEEPRPLPNIFKSQEISQEPDEGLFKRSDFSLFGQNIGCSTNMQTTTNIFSQVAQNNPLESQKQAQPQLPGEKAGEHVKKESRSALSQFSNQMGSFFGKEE